MHFLRWSLLGLAFPILAAPPIPSFADRYDYPECVSTNPGNSIAAADFNGDGIPDLICSGNGFYLFLGTGDGAFGLPTVIEPLGSDHVVGAPVPVDLNGDGKIDLVGGGSEGQTAGIVVALGNGDGTFEPGTFYPMEDSFTGVFIVTGDFNGDGIPDVAAEVSGGIWLLTGQGNGMLNPGVLIPMSDPTDNGLVAADVNGDGKLDFVADTATGFAVFLGNGDGTFQPEIDTPVPFPGGGSGFAVGDLNGDGHPDVVVVSGQETFGLPYFGKGNGTFTVGRELNLGAGSYSVALGDVDGDGLLDVMTASGWVAYGNGKGQFSAPKSYLIGGGDGEYVGPATLTKSGRTDFLFQNNYTPASVLISEGKGRFEEGERVAISGGGAGCSTTADFNGDGIPDLAILVNEGISILLGTGKALAPFTQGQILSVTDAWCPVTGDLNGDGIPDLVSASGSPSGFAVAFLGNGDGTFSQVAKTTPMSTTGLIALGDFNGDGKLDWASTTNLLAMGNGDGTFQTPKSYIPNLMSGSIFGIAAARLNGKRESDIVLTSPSSNLVYVLLSTGTGFQQTTFSSTNYSAGCDAPTIPVLADVNGDGTPDLVLECGLVPIVPIFLNNGEGQFTYSTGFLVNLSGGDAFPIVADVNGDGIADIIVIAGSDLDIYLGEGSMEFEYAMSIGTLGSPQDLFALSVHGQNPKSGLLDLVVPDSTGVLDVILNTTRK